MKVRRKKVETPAPKLRGGYRTDPITGHRLYAIDTLNDRIRDLRQAADRLETLRTFLEDKHLCDHEAADTALWWLIYTHRV